MVHPGHEFAGDIGENVIMAVVFSPSNLSTFRTCPRKFYGQSISKEIKWQGTKQKSRGTAMHNFVQQAVRTGWPDAGMTDTTADSGYTRNVVEILRGANAEIFIEHEMSITAQGKSCDWWAGDASLRARADVFLLPKDDSPMLVGDIKTGKNWDDDHLQLRIECLLAHIIYGRPVVKYQYWYIDQGETEEGLIDFRNGLDPVRDIYALLQDASLAVKNNDFPAKENRFCKWCAWHKRQECGI